MNLNQIAKAIGNPHRMQILTLLMAGLEGKNHPAR